MTSKRVVGVGVSCLILMTSTLMPAHAVDAVSVTVHPLLQKAGLKPVPPCSTEEWTEGNALFRTGCVRVRDTCELDDNCDSDVLGCVPIESSWEFQRYEFRDVSRNPNTDWKIQKDKNTSWKVEPHADRVCLRVYAFKDRGHNCIGGNSQDQKQENDCIIPITKGRSWIAAEFRVTLRKKI